MNTTVMVMHALKETCALHCLVALHLAGPGPVTQQTVMAITGFEDSAVHRGLHKLRALGLATCTGQRHHTAWQLAPAAAELALGLPSPLPPQALPPARPPLPAPSAAPPAAPTPDPSAVIPAQGESAPSPAVPAQQESKSPGARAPSPVRRESAPTARRPNPARRESISGAQHPNPVRQESISAARHPNPVRRESISAAQRPNPVRGESISGAQHPNPVRGESALERESGESLILKDQTLYQSQLHQIFHHAKIWPGGRAQLARELVQAGGARWVNQALGWLCYAVRCLPTMNTGAVLFSALRDRLDIAPEFLPPPDLPFADALDWAARGGEEPAGYANAVEADDGRPATALGGAHAADDRWHTDEGRMAKDEGGSGPPDEGRMTKDEGGEADDGGQTQPPSLHPWPAVLARLKAESPGGQVHPWVAGAKLVAAGPGAWRLLVKDPLARAWINNRLRERLANLLGEVLGEGVRLEVAEAETRGMLR